jgi:hypothetical protein
MLIAALIFLAVVLVSVATVLLYISGMSSRSNGWARLAELYRLEGPFPERRVGFLTTTLNGYVLQHLMVVGIGENGLALRPIQLFRAFHPSLLVPWAKLRTSRHQTEFGISYRVELGQPDMRIEWSEGVHRQIMAEVPAGWPPARAALEAA